MRNAELVEAQAGVKIAGRNINNLRYADDTTFMAESEEELKSLLMKVKVESEKVGLKLNIQKTKIMASGPITSWQIEGETVETVADFIFLGSKITADGDCSHEIKRCLLCGRKAMTNLDSILKSSSNFDGSVRNVDVYTYYWSSEVDASNLQKANAFYIKTATSPTMKVAQRRTGLVIRAVERTKGGNEDPKQATLVDLGLSVKWADKNVGATDESPYGDYYAWGETSTKDDYTWANYQHASGSASTVRDIAYTTKSVSGDSVDEDSGTWSIVDNKLTIKEADEDFGVTTMTFDIELLDKKNMTLVYEESSSELGMTYNVNITIKMKRI